MRLLIVLSSRQHPWFKRTTIKRLFKFESFLMEVLLWVFALESICACHIVCFWNTLSYAYCFWNPLSHLTWVKKSALRQSCSSGRSQCALLSMLFLSSCENSHMPAWRNHIFDELWQVDCRLRKNLKHARNVFHDDIPVMLSSVFQELKRLVCSFGNTEMKFVIACAFLCAAMSASFAQNEINEGRRNVYFFC